MSKKVTIVDYGMGNLLSVKRALEYCGAEVNVTEKLSNIASIDRLVLPGVGAFGDCMAELKERGLQSSIMEYIVTGRPFLGICVGMQVLLDESEEFGFHQGLGIIAGKVKAIPNTSASGVRHNIPHIGWTEIYPPNCQSVDHKVGVFTEGVLRGIRYGTSCYFVHSYTAEPLIGSNRLADSYYNGRRIAAAIIKDNVVGLQFHPEKSGVEGIKILSNFMEV